MAGAARTAGEGVPRRLSVDRAPVRRSMLRKEGRCAARRIGYAFALRLAIGVYQLPKPGASPLRPATILLGRFHAITLRLRNRRVGHWPLSIRSARRRPWARSTARPRPPQLGT